MADLLTPKQEQYNQAMKRYETMRGYLWVGSVVSFIIVGAQVVLATQAVQHSIGIAMQVVVLVTAFVAADFVNGLVHMYMDNNDGYTSLVGPLVASFHLHHRTPRYKEKPLIEVYYHEAGAKLWLAVISLVAVPAAWHGSLTGSALYGVLYFSLFSCAAEVAHYLCHVPVSTPVRVLEKLGVFMKPQYHVRHHLQDNQQYAFLNGMTDPLIDIIAKNMYHGYKQGSDTHYAFYEGAGTANR